MDKRFSQAPILKRRKDEWDKENIRSSVEKIFKAVSLIEGWEFISCRWSTTKRSKRFEELKGNALSLLKIMVKNPYEQEVTYDIQIPNLINNQFFYIGGYLKIPIFQIYDFPIIFRNNFLKLRTNTISISLDMNKPNVSDYKISLFNKTIPIDTFITASCTKEEFDEFMSEKTEECYDLMAVATACYEKWASTTELERIEEVGSYFETAAGFDPVKKGKSVLFSLKSAYEVDFFSREFLHTNSLTFELLNAIYEGQKPDTDIRRKRVRFLEYILSPLVRKVYDMLLTLHNSKKIKFQIPQTVVLDDCNVSDIVHFNLAVNPVSEIASFCQMTLTGPGGFKKDNVPAPLRNLDISQFGYICGADTPDRDGCGVVLNAVPTIDVDERGCFGEADTEVITSFPISLVPFCEHDDPIRLQMASNQMKQSLLLENPSKPYVKSGVEDCFMDNTTFLYKAKDVGIVVHLDDNFMIVKYNNGESDIFEISYRSMYLGAIDQLIPFFKEGDDFNKDDILCSSGMLTDGELSLGQNLLTAITVWKGFNYEDGIVISDAVSDKKFTSKHGVDMTFTIEPGQVLLSLIDDTYSPLPKIGDSLQKGDVCAKVKVLDGEDGFESINIEPHEVIAPIDCTITSIEIYPNSWNKKVKEFDKYIQELMVSQADKYNNLYLKLEAHLGTEEADQFVMLHGLSRLDCTKRSGRYTNKGKKVGGIFIKVHGIYKEKIGIGDKIANRHGNKGVISKIVPEDKMPVLPDGRRIEVILNPLGIISRMNVGQLYELHMNEAMYQLKNKLKGIKWKREKVKLLKGFLDIIDKSPEQWTSKRVIEDYRQDLKRAGSRKSEIGIAEDNLYIIQPPFQSMKANDLIKGMEYADAEMKQKLYDPSSKMEIKNLIAVGYIYFLKLVHRSSDKMSARSIGPYSKKTLQPLGGKARLGGHRLGEMEVWSLVAHGADNVLRDFLTLQSDSPGLKNKFLADILQNPELATHSSTDTRPQSLRLFEAYLKILGLELNM